MSRVMIPLALSALSRVRGRLLDDVAKGLGLPARSVLDDTGHVPVMESDASYRHTIATALRIIAATLEGQR